MPFSFLKYPKKAITKKLTHADQAVFLQLLRHHDSMRKQDYDLPFYVSDRDLALESNTSTRTVWKAKIKLKKLNLINYTTGSGNRTYYKIMPELQLELFEKKEGVSF